MYPKIWLVKTSVQRKNANYFGRFIDKAIEEIRPEELEEANRKGEPTVLIIGSTQYLRQIEEHLLKAGRTLETRQDHSTALSAERAFELLKNNSESNLGWRMALEIQKKGLVAECVRNAGDNTPLYDVIPEVFKKNVLAEVEEFECPDESEVGEEEKEQDGLKIKLTSCEAAKGLSAQHVFLVGLHAGDLPKDAENIHDLEICKFVVGLTRTKKRCALLWTKCFGSDWKEPSIFLRWIKDERYEPITVDREYWEKTNSRR